jgi:hypothetical protein
VNLRIGCLAEADGEYQDAGWEELFQLDVKHASFLLIDADLSKVSA